MSYVGVHVLIFSFTTVFIFVCRVQAGDWGLRTGSASAGISSFPPPSSLSFFPTKFYRILQFQSQKTHLFKAFFSWMTHRAIYSYGVYLFSLLHSFFPIFSFYLCALPTCVYVHKVYAMFKRLENSIASFGTRVTDGCGSPCRSWKWNSGPLEEKLLLFSTESSLHLPTACWILNISYWERTSLTCFYPI